MCCTRLVCGKLEAEKQHVGASLSRPAGNEALALAIEAKDETTGEHERVRIYAMELAKELGLSEDETEALRAASCCTTLEVAVP